jgi:CheY-like chemotaxis protein
MTLDAGTRVPEGTRLLLVDPNEITRTEVSARLVDAGMAVQACRFPEYGAGWLKRAKREGKPFGAVITDIVFPAVPQLEVITFLKTLVRREIPTIIFTAGAWEKPPDVGFSIVPKDHDNYWGPLYSAIASVLMSHGEHASMANPAAFRKLTRPEGHIASPMAKWMSAQIQTLSSGGMGIAEKYNVVAELEILQMRREMSQALKSENGQLSKRDVEEMWGKYEQLLQMRRQSSVQTSFRVLPQIPQLTAVQQPAKRALARIA